MSTQSGAPYARVERSLWTEPAFRAIPADARLIFLYLLTGPHSHMCGLSHLSLATTADDLGLDLDCVRAALAGPLADRVEYDGETREVFLADAGRIQLGPELETKDKRHLHVLRHVESIHSERLKQRFLAVYAGPWNLNDEAPTDAPPEGATDAPPQANSSSSRSRQDHYQPQEQRHRQKGVQGENGRPAGRSTDDSTEDVNGVADRGEFDDGRIAQAAKAVSKPGRSDYNRRWIAADPEARVPWAEGLVYRRMDPDSGFERGELFHDLEKLFDKNPSLRAQCEGAWYRAQDAETPRTRRLETAG